MTLFNITRHHKLSPEYRALFYSTLSKRSWLETIRNFVSKNSTIGYYPVTGKSRKLQENFRSKSSIRNPFDKTLSWCSSGEYLSYLELLQVDRVSDERI